MRKAKQTKCDYILVDRSGSMANKWDETISSLNSYVATLAEEPATQDTKVTVAFFDHNGFLNFDVVRQGQTPKEFVPILNSEVSPRGYTPLFDAIGRIVEIANNEKPDNCAIIIMTDGLENSSREVSKEAAKLLLDACRTKKWQIIFLGADFDNFDQAGGLGNSVRQTIAVSGTNLQGVMQATASMRSAFADDPNVHMIYSADFQKAAQQAIAMSKKIIKEKENARKDSTK